MLAPANAPTGVEADLHEATQVGSPENPLPGTPGNRSGHSATLVGSRMFVFGGFNEGEVLGDLSVFHVDQCRWEEPPQRPDVPAPDARASHSAELAGRHVFVFGGTGSTWGASNKDDLWRLDTDTLQWEELDTGTAGPFASYGHSLTAHGASLLLFGGSDGHMFSNSLWELPLAPRRPRGGLEGAQQQQDDGEEEEEPLAWRFISQSGQVPEPQYKHTVVRVSDSTLLLVEGTTSTQGAFGRLHVYSLDLSSFAWAKLTDDSLDTPSRLAPTVVCVPPVHGDHASTVTVLVLGGRLGAATTPPCREVLRWDAETRRWTMYGRLPQTAARFFQSVVCAEAVLWFFGGNDGHARVNELWRLAVRESPPSLLILALRKARASLATLKSSELLQLPMELLSALQHVNDRATAVRLGR